MYYILLFLHLIYAIAIHGSKPVVSLFANSQGASALIIGILVSTYSFFPMLMAIKIGKWLDQYGAKRILLNGASLIIFAILCPILLPNLTGMFLLQILFGFAQIFIVVSIQKTIGNLEGSRDQLIATMSFMASAGGLIGPLLCGYIYQHLGIKITYLVLLILVLISWCVILAIPVKKWPKMVQVKQVEKRSSLHMLKQTSLRNALVISGLSLYSKELFSAYFPVLASNKGFSAGTIGVLLSLSAAASMLVRFLQAGLVRKYGRGMVLLTTLIISGISYISIPFFSNLFIIIVLVLLLGGGLGLGQPLSLVYALNSSPRNRQGEFLGLRLTVNRAAQVTAPLIFGALGSLSGVQLIFWASGAFLFIGTYFTRSMKQSDKDRKLHVK